MGNDQTYPAAGAGLRIARGWQALPAAWRGLGPVLAGAVVGAKVLAIEDITAWLPVIRPSSRFRLSDVLEKFSEPMNTLAWLVP